jgi:hypothetical protein
MEEFVNAVKEMRRLQRQYFSTRNKNVLQRSKDAEREVDKMIQNYNQIELPFK